MGEDVLDNLTFNELKARFKKVSTSHDTINEELVVLKKNNFKKLYEETLESKNSLVKVAQGFKSKILEHEKLLIQKEEKYTKESNKKEALSKQKIKNLTDKITNLQENYNKDKEKLEQEIFTLNNSTTLVKNKFNTLMGDINRVYRTIVRLNATTPYRPGEVERVLKEIKDELELVKNVYIN